jgi:hypothetical protein
VASRSAEFSFSGFLYQQIEYQCEDSLASGVAFVRLPFGKGCLRSAEGAVSAVAWGNAPGTRLSQGSKR